MKDFNGIKMHGATIKKKEDYLYVETGCVSYMKHLVG